MGVVGCRLFLGFLLSSGVQTQHNFHLHHVHLWACVVIFFVPVRSMSLGIASSGGTCLHNFAVFLAILELRGIRCYKASMCVDSRGPSELYPRIIVRITPVFCLCAFAEVLCY